MFIKMIRWSWKVFWLVLTYHFHVIYRKKWGCFDLHQFIHGLNWSKFSLKYQKLTHHSLHLSTTYSLISCVQSLCCTCDTAVLYVIRSRPTADRWAHCSVPPLRGVLQSRGERPSFDGRLLLREIPCKLCIKCPLIKISTQNDAFIA